MAGGSGTRLWPLSRQTRPKQVLRLLGDRSMFQMAVDRVRPILPPEQILVITTEDIVDDLAEQTPEIPACNFVVEPQARGTAPAICLGALHAEWMAGSEAVIACLTADHYIRDVDQFQNVLQAAAQVAERGHIVTLGIEPTFASTGYGYIERGDFQMEVGDLSVYGALRFKEKPGVHLATQFMDDGRHTWNSGMFIWTTSRVREEFEIQVPEMAPILRKIRSALGTPQLDEDLASIWALVPRLTIDYGIMEGAKNVSVIPVSIGWSDVGSWASLLEIIDSDENGNVVIRGNHKSIDTKNTLIHAQRLVATIGITDTIIVDTPEVLLVCSADRAQEVRALVQILGDADQTLL